MSDKELTKREQDMLSPTFVTLIEFGTKWFGNDLMLASMDEFYDHCWDAWHSTDDYKQQRQKLKISLFRLLCNDPLKSCSGHNEWRSQT